MRKGKSRVKTYKAEGGADYGPALRLRADGRLAAWGGAAAVDIESRDDPGIIDRRRIIRGARRRDALADLEARRVITKRMRDAAEQFLEDCSIAAGSTSNEGPGGFPSIAGPRAGLPERQVAAIVRINTVRHLLGLNEGTVFWHVVFLNGSLSAYETANRMRSGAATDMLRNALNALDEHFHRTTTRKGT